MRCVNNKRMNKRALKETVISFRADGPLLKRIEQAAKEMDRLRADAIRRLVIRGLDAEDIGNVKR